MQAIVWDDVAFVSDVPGKNPGTSTKTSRGMLKLSQNLVNLAAFLEASTSNTPARDMG